MNTEWISVNQQLPEDGEAVLCSIKQGNSFYHEILGLEHSSGIWKYNNGTPLEDGKTVVGWKSSGSTFIG